MDEYRNKQKQKWVQSNPQNIIDLTKDDEKIAQELQKQFEKESLTSNVQNTKKEEKKPIQKENIPLKRDHSKTETFKKEEPEKTKIPKPDTSMDEELARMLQEELENENLLLEESLKEEEQFQRDREYAEKIQKEFEREIKNQQELEREIKNQELFEMQRRNEQPLMGLHRDLFNFPNFPTIPNIPMNLPRIPNNIQRIPNNIQRNPNNNQRITRLDAFEDELLENMFYEYVDQRSNDSFTSEDYETLLELDQNNVKKPLPKNLIDKTCKKLKIDKEIDNNCSICQDKLQKGEEALQLPCSHLFHSQCILPWFEQSRKCPNCQKEIDSVKDSKK